jgi:hypothetical protein
MPRARSISEFSFGAAEHDIAHLHIHVIRPIAMLG